MAKGGTGNIPSMARGAKSRANLKRGGRLGTKRNVADDKEIARISKALLRDPQYCKNLKVRLRSGRLQPGVEVMLWYYAWGRPVEVVETKQITPVRVVHEYTKAPGSKDDE